MALSANGRLGTAVEPERKCESIEYGVSSIGGELRMSVCERTAEDSRPYLEAG